MTPATTILTGKSLHAISKAPASSKKPMNEQIFTPREVILHHAVDVHDSQVNSKHKVLGTVLKTLNESLFRALKSHFEITYRR